MAFGNCPGLIHPHKEERNALGTGALHRGQAMRNLFDGRAEPPRHQFQIVSRVLCGLQELLIGQEAGSKDSTSRPSLRGRSGMRLSDRFSQYYKLVARSGGKTNSSLAVIASDIYLDMQETSRLIARTREEISRATLMEQLNQSFGTITPEMQEVVSGVKAILFGEEMTGEMPVAIPPSAPAEHTYESALQM